MLNTLQFWGLERFSGVKNDYRVVIMLFCLTLVWNQNWLRGLASWSQLFLMFYQFLLMVLYLVFYYFLNTKASYILLIKNFKVTIYVIINLYVIKIGSVANFITPITQKVKAATLTKLPKVTCLLKLICRILIPEIKSLKTTCPLFCNK